MDDGRVVPLRQPARLLGKTTALLQVASRLAGSDAESLTQDAESLRKILVRGAAEDRPDVAVVGIRHPRHGGVHHTSVNEDVQVPVHHVLDATQQAIVTLQKPVPNCSRPSRASGEHLS